MPSSAQPSSYASASSSRHAEFAASHPKSSRPHRRSEDAHTGPSSPDSSYYSQRPDAARPRYEDDRRSYHRSSRDPKYRDDRDYTRSSRSAYSPPPRERRESVYDSSSRDHYERQVRYRSPEHSAPSRRYRSPDSAHGWDVEPRGRWDLHSDREASRRSTEDPSTRRPGRTDGAYGNDDRRNGRSPDRFRGSYTDRESRRSQYSDDYDTLRHRDDHRDSRRHARNFSRSRSRSRERLRASRARDNYASSTPDEYSQAAANGERRSDAYGFRGDPKLLKRKADSGARAADSTNNLQSPYKDKVSDQNGTEYRLEPLSSASRDVRETNGSREVNGSVEAKQAVAIHRHIMEARRSDRPHEQSRESQIPATPSSKPVAPRSHNHALEPPVPQTTKVSILSTKMESPAREATNGIVSKRSFGHVQLPHELPVEVRGRNNMATAPYKENVKWMYKTAAEKLVVDVKTEDPRRGSRKTNLYRDALHRARFVWDANSVGKKPLPPPRNLVLTNLSALMQPAQLLLHIRPFGRVESSKLEVDPKIGQSLGIFWVTFAHDFDEHGKVLHSVASDQTPQHGAKVAKAAQLALNGRQMGPTRIVTFLDRSGEVLAEKIKEKTAANEAKLRHPAPAAPAAHASASPATPSTSKPNMPPPNIPRGPRSSAVAAHSPLISATPTTIRPSTDHYDNSPSRYPRSGASSEEVRKSSPADLYNRRRDRSDYDSRPSRSYASGQSEWSARSSSPARAESRRKRYPKLATEEIMNTLRKSEFSYAFIPKPKSCDIESSEVEEYMKDTPPRWVREGDTGWYAAFTTLEAARACKLVYETLTIGGYTLQVDVRRAPSKLAHEPDSKKPSSTATMSPRVNGTRIPAHASLVRKTLDTGLRPLTAEEKQKDNWTASELQEAVLRMLQKELADTFIRDVKSRVVGPHLTSYLKPGNEGGHILAKAVIKRPSVVPTIDRISTMSSADIEARLPSFRKVASAKPKKTDSIAEKAGLKVKRDVTRGRKDRELATNSVDNRAKPMSAAKKRGTAAWLLGSSDEELDSDDAASTEPDATSRSVSTSVEPGVAEHKEEEEAAGITKAKKKSRAKPESTVKKKEITAKKGAKATSVVDDIDVEGDDGDETAIPETDTATKTAKAKVKPTKAPAKQKPIPADPFDAGLVEDSEDLYYLRHVLERLNHGETISEDTYPDEVELEAEAEQLAVEAGKPPKHITGSARTEGMYKIPPEQKAAHLPDRNKATEDADTTTNAQVLQSARNNRADSRRLVLGIEQHKRETATDTDIFKFNQLRTRKKQLKFAKSPIHDWGLYAMEYIPAGDMVIEYVGEVVRQQVADEREKQYERQGNFSTYLFRVDDDLVVDATHKGNIARLMNHCCTPNCNAKILTLNGEKRIVLFAKTAIRAGEELTYDYKFQSSADDEDAIPCLCGSPGCRRFL